MRNPNFRFVGLWAKQFGGGVPAGAATVFNFPPGETHHFTPPFSGKWKFVAWGPSDGGDGVSASCSSGAYLEKTAFVSTSQTVIITMPYERSVTINIPGQPLCTAGIGILSGSPAATGGDVNLPGTLPSQMGQGSGAGPGYGGAPGILPFRGGTANFTPGGAGGVDGNATGGDGFVIVVAVP